MMTCDEVKVLVHGLLDVELDAARVREVESHLATCPGCAAELADFRQMRQVLRNPDLRLAAPDDLRRRPRFDLTRNEKATFRQLLQALYE